MLLDLWWRGLILGFAIAAPVGPIGLLCIQRTLSGGQLLGLFSGLGAATADAFYGAVAAFGLTLVSTFLLSQQHLLGLVGGLFLCYLGVRTWLAAPAVQAAHTSNDSGFWGAYTSTLFLTLTNPVTILSFVAIFAGAGLAANGNDAGGALAMVAGVFCGSAVWWLLLSGGVSLLRSRFNQQILRWVNRIAGVVIATFGVFALASLLG